MAIGAHRVIDEVVPEDFAILAGDIGLATSALRRIAQDPVGHVVPAIMATGELVTPAVDSLSSDAGDLADDMTPRLEVLDAFARGQ